MKTEEKIRGMEAEIEMIQNEIDRRHSRRDSDTDSLRNQEKIDDLRRKRAKLQERVEKLKK